MQSIPEGGIAARFHADPVSLHPVLPRAGTDDQHALYGVAGNDVAGARRRAADHVASGVIEEHPVAGVAQGVRAGHISADVVPLHPIAHHEFVAAEEDHAVLTVPGDDVACRRRYAPDQIVARTKADEHADAGVSQVDSSGSVCADQVAEHHVPGCTRIADDDANRVPGHEVAGALRRAANHVGPRAGVTSDAGPPVAECHGAGPVGADHVSADHVSARARDRHTVAAIPGNDVARTVRRPPDDVVVPLVDVHAVQGVTPVDVAGWVAADGAPHDKTAVRADANAVTGEAINGQAANHRRRAAGQDQEAAAVCGTGAVQLDEGRAREARLGLTGNRHPVGDRRQEGGQIDRLESGADGELDAVSAGRGIRSVDGPPQRAGAPVIGIGDHEGGRGQTVLKCFNRQVRTRSREGRRSGHRLILEEQDGRGSWRWPMASLTRSSRAGKKIPLVQGRYVTVMLSENVGGVAQFVGGRGRPNRMSPYGQPPDTSRVVKDRNTSHGMALAV